MSNERPARKVGLSACVAAPPWRRAALGAAVLATVASGAGVVAGLALGGAPAADPPSPECAAPGSGAGAAPVPIGAPASAGAAPARGFTGRTSGVAATEQGSVVGLPAPVGASERPSAERAGEPRRSRAQRLVSEQLDAMVARAAEAVPDAADAGGDTDPATEAFPDPASGELQQETARAVLAGMLEGFAGVPPRAQGSPDAATQP